MTGGIMSTRWPGIALNYQQKISLVSAVAGAPLHEAYTGVTFGLKSLGI